MLIIGCDYHPGMQQIAFVDIDTGELSERRLSHREEGERGLKTHPGVGPLTALAFELVIGTPERFPCGKQLASYIGLVPEEKSSGDRRRLGHISKQGNVLLRFLLVEAAQVTVRSQPEWRNTFFTWPCGVDGRSPNYTRLRFSLRFSTSGNPGYRFILVYDVSRWGRFQDADESAHYENLCKLAAVPLHYCAEMFANDGTQASFIMSITS